MDAKQLLAELRAHANPANVEGMARYGINVKGTLGVSMPLIRELGKKAGRSHETAAELWDSGIHEARILASLVEEPARVTPAQMNRWARDFDSWDVCDQVCANLFRYTPYAFDKAVEWSAAKPEFVRRAAFALMAGLAVKAKKEPDERFEAFFPLIAAAATDDRNLIMKGVNWALRQIGKRSPGLCQRAIAEAERIGATESKPARWIAADALRELRRRAPSHTPDTAI